MLFLFALFIAGGTEMTDIVRRRPRLLFAICVVVGGSFYSLRVLR